MDDLKVRIRFKESPEGEFDCLELDIEVLGQRFYCRKRLLASMAKIETMFPVNYIRYKAGIFGEMLENAANEIKMQAEHGEPQEFEENGIRIKRF